MQNPRTYSIATFGIAEMEQDILKRICSLSANRSNAYTIIQDNEADIHLVNSDDSPGLDAWRQARATHAAPAVAIAEQHPADTNYHLRRPLMATRVLHLLDELVQQELGGSPSAPPTSRSATNGGVATPIPEVPSNAHPTPQMSDQGVPKPVPKISPSSPVASPPKAAPPPSATPTPSPPVAGQEQKIPVPSPTANQTSTAEAQRRRALVVDDSPPVRKQLGLVLAKARIDTEFADSGEVAVKLLEHQTYDIVFLDVVMPGIDGYEVCKAIKRNKDKKHIPVIMLTGKSSPFDKVKGKLSGCDAYLTKPVSKEHFQETLSKYLKQNIVFN